MSPSTFISSDIFVWDVYFFFFFSSSCRCRTLTHLSVNGRTRGNDICTLQLKTPTHIHPLIDHHVEPHTCVLTILSLRNRKKSLFHNLSLFLIGCGWQPYFSHRSGWYEPVWPLTRTPNSSPFPKRTGFVPVVVPGSVLSEFPPPRRSSPSRRLGNQVLHSTIPIVSGPVESIYGDLFYISNCRY